MVQVFIKMLALFGVGVVPQGINIITTDILLLHNLLATSDKTLILSCFNGESSAFSTWHGQSADYSWQSSKLVNSSFCFHSLSPILIPILDSHLGFRTFLLEFEIA